MDVVVSHIKIFIWKIIISFCTIIVWSPFCFVTERPWCQEVNTATSNIIDFTVCNTNIINLCRHRKFNISSLICDNVHCDTTGCFTNVSSRTMETMNDHIINIDMFQFSNIFCLNRNTAAVYIICTVSDVFVRTLCKVCFRVRIKDFQTAYFPVFYIIELNNVVNFYICYHGICAHDIVNSPVFTWLKNRSCFTVSISTDLNRHTFCTGSHRFKASYESFSVFEKDLVARSKCNGVQFINRSNCCFRC